MACAAARRADLAAGARLECLMQAAPASEGAAQQVLAIKRLDFRLELAGLCVFLWRRRLLLRGVTKNDS